MCTQKKKLRKRGPAADGEELEAAALDIAALEAAAAAEGRQDHGSRKTAVDKVAKAAADRAAEQQRKQERYATGFIRSLDLHAGGHVCCDPASCASWSHIHSQNGRHVPLCIFMGGTYSVVAREKAVLVKPLPGWPPRGHCSCHLQLEPSCAEI